MSISKDKSINSKMHYFSIAVSVVILFMFNSCAKNKPEYSDYSNHETAGFYKKDSDPNLKKAQGFFNAKQYGKAIYSFEETEDLTNPEVQYFYAIALIETNHYKYARLYLDNIRSGNSAYKDKATWYLALSYLKQKKIKECKTYLKQVPADSEDYEKAQKLLKDLE